MQIYMEQERFFYIYFNAFGQPGKLVKAVRVASKHRSWETPLVPLASTEQKKRGGEDKKNKYLESFSFLICAEL